MGVVFLACVLRYAWMSDDAFISFRTVANWVHGHGLVANLAERVQAFTNPLWTLLLIPPYAALKNAYWAAMGLSLAVDVLFVVVLLRRRDANVATLLTLCLLTASRSFVTFSTSGLENGLAHLLLAAFVLEELRERPWRPWAPWLLGGLIAVNRLDHLLLVLPLLVLRVRREGVRASLRPAAIGLGPLVAWLAFSVFYYGFPWPNTAYAKLNAVILRRELVMQGLSYLVDATLRDGIMAVVVGAALVLGIRERKRVRAMAGGLCGMGLYLAYVTWIGGDFMGGRFCTAPYLVAALLLGETLENLPKPALAAVVASVLLWGRWVLEPLPTDPKTECVVIATGIVDERACYVEHTGIYQNFRAKKYESHPYFKTGLEFRQKGERVSPSTIVGMAGYAAGPRVHLIDYYALTDPLLARIQYKPADEWRIGHFRREIPKGYVESLLNDDNRLEDPCLHRLYADLRLVTRGRLLSTARFAAIWRLNFGQSVCPAPP